MCGRYSIFTPIDLIVQALGFDLDPVELDPRFNAAPSQLLPVITNDQPHKIQFFKWGLVPSWAKDQSIGNKMINARSETVMEKPSFRKPMEKRRCLVLADGFYEWKQAGSGKIPYHIRLKNRGLITIAGLWESWNDAEGKEIKSFTLLTTHPNEITKHIHDRMPVIVEPVDRERWLNPAVPATYVLDILKPYPAEFMEAVAVSSLVNSPAYDSADILNPPQSLF